MRRVVQEKKERSHSLLHLTLLPSRQSALVLRLAAVFPVWKARCPDPHRRKLQEQSLGRDKARNRRMCVFRGVVGWRQGQGRIKDKKINLKFRDSKRKGYKTK